MGQRNDQIFQLSLTEIAFTIAFLLLLLLGYLVYMEQTDRLAAEQELAKVKTAEQAIAALDEARDLLAETLQGAGVSSPDEIISALIAADQIRDERNRLRQQVEDLDAKLTALTELQGQLDLNGSRAAQDVVASALALQNQVLRALEESRAATAEPTELNQADIEPDSRQVAEDAMSAILAGGVLKKELRDMLGIDLEPGQESQSIRDIVSAARSFGELSVNGASFDAVSNENSDLRGQVAYLTNRLNGRGGRDHPPCWADESGKVEYLFSIDLQPDSVLVTSAWPEHRGADALGLPGIEEALAQPQTLEVFLDRIQGIYNWSKSHDPECRHYVLLKSSISDAIQSDRARLMVEDFFYKNEIRR